MIYAIDAADDQAPDQHTVDRPTTCVSAAVNGWCLRCDNTQLATTPAWGVNGAPSIGFGGKRGVR